MEIKKILLIVFVLVVGCTHSNQNETIPVIDIERALFNPSDILLSDFVDEIEYIPLENLPESVTGRGLQISKTDQYLVAISFRLIQLFDRKTGNYLRTIGRYGQGPNEYMATIPPYGYDENRQSILCIGPQNNMIEYDLEGNVIRRIFLPEGVFGPSRIALDESNFVLFKDNPSGNDPYKLFLFDTLGNIINKFANYNSYIKDPRSTTIGTCVFTKFNNNLLFYEQCVDTLFIVTKKDLIPYFHIKQGKYLLPYSERNNWYKPPEKPMINQYIRMGWINESDRFIFFSFFHDNLDKGGQVPCYFGFYDKKTGITKISDIDDTKRGTVLNDIDNFAPFYFIGSINQTDELVTYMQTDDIIEWFEANPEKAKKLPKHLQELSKIKIGDNEVVVIAKLKQ